MLQVIQRIENSVPHPALPRRRAHAIEQQRILPLRRTRVVLVITRVQLQPVHPARIHLLEQRHKPVGLLVINRNRLAALVPLLAHRLAHKLRHAPPNSKEAVPHILCAVFILAPADPGGCAASSPAPRPSAISLLPHDFRRSVLPAPPTRETPPVACSADNPAKPLSHR